jgi:hypothetical protein
MAVPNDGEVHLSRPPTVKKKHAGGRPTKLTEELIKKIEAAMRAGAYIETAAAHAGVAPLSLRRWLRQGAEGKGGLIRKFCTAMEKAEADAELWALGTVQNFAAGLTVEIVTTTTRGTGEDAITETKTERRPVREWTAAAWYLERRRPQRWGRRVVELQGKDGVALSPLGQVLIMLPPKEDSAITDAAESARVAILESKGGLPGGNGGNGGNGRPKPAG